MRTAPGSAVALLFTCAFFLGCGGSQSSAEAPTEAEPAPSSTEAKERPALTAEACEAGGGTVVGDIGDGAIHKADYRCPSGAEPSGTISAPEGGPIGVEGSVCCPK